MNIRLNQFFYRYLENLILPIIINQIKNVYDFKEGFDFYGWLRDLRSWSELYKEHESLTVIREMKTEFTNLVDASTALTDLVTNFLKRRDGFSKYVDPYKYEILRNGPKLKLTYEELRDILMDFKLLWRNGLKLLPAIEKGRPSETHNKRCVNLLVMMFMEGSELEPICYRNDYQEGQYCGFFYDFMIDMLPVLRSQGITLDIKNESLGRYAVELIAKRRTVNPCSHKISQIEELPLQE